MPFRTIAVALTGNNTDLSASLRRAANDVSAFDTSTRRSAKNVQDSTGLISRAFQDVHSQLERGVNRSLAGFTVAATGAYAAGRALNAALRDVVGGAVEFDARMRNVNSISGLSEASLHQLGAQVIDLSKQLPQSANNLAEGLYDIASSGFQGAAGVQVLTAAATAATAGLSTTATAAQAITSVLNAYGLQASQANDVSDALFQTVNVGVVNFDQLAGTIGDVVGIAAAAHVDINQVGTALATMTLSGISAAEAGTSLNRVIQSILQPSQAMATVFHQLGYESGESALKTKGLRGVMEDLRQSTGGNVTTLLNLFTDIRAARGAFALMAQDGQSYARVAGQIDDANTRQGATHRALAEQLKSVSAQWELFKNRVHAVAIDAGTTLLPTLLDLLRETSHLGREGIGTLEDAMERLAPFFRAVRDIGVDVVDIFRSLYNATEPLAKALLTIGAGAVIGGLNALATALAAVFNFVDQNKTVFEILAGVIGALMLPSLVSLTVGFNRLILTPIVTALVTPFVALAGALAGDSAAVATLTAGFGALATAEGVATLGITALVALGGVGLYRLQQATQNAKHEISGLTQGFDPNDARGAIAYFGTLQKFIDSSSEKFNSFNRVSRGASRLGLGPGTQDLKDAQAGRAELDKLQDSTLNTYKNANRLGTQFGVLGDQVVEFAQKNNIDLSKPWDQSATSIQKVRDGLSQMESQSGLSAGALSNAAGMDTDAMQALAKAVEQTVQSVSSAFAGATDVIAAFDPTGAAKGVTDAQDRLVQSQQSLADLEARQATQKKRTVSDAQQLAKARRDVADATDAVNKAQKTQQETGTLAGADAAQIQSARTFATQIQSVLTRGLDPEFVQRLLEAGPQKAAPVLQALVSDHSGRLIAMQNKTEATLRAINERVVEFTRLTTLAVQASTDQYTRDLPNAVKIEQAMGGAKTLDALTKQLHLSPSEIAKIAAEFGITLPKAIQAQLDKHPVTVTTVATTVGGRRVPQPRVASGGYIDGPGTGTSDSIPAWLSNGEFVQRAAAVDYYGVDFMSRLNSMQLPRFADGGYIGVPPGGGIGATAVTVVQRPNEYHVRNETNLHGVQFGDADAFERFEARERRKRAVWN